MKASLDTNAIIHLYNAGLQSVLFDLFDEGVFIYEQIRNVELEHHGKGILEQVDEDIRSGRIEIYTAERLRKLSVYRIFENNVNENRTLYRPGDLGEVYAISLAQTLGALALVTDDTKRGGPYMSLLQCNGEIMALTFADVLILRYLFGLADECTTANDFDAINDASNLNWSLRSQLGRFIRRFWTDPHRDDEKIWLQKLIQERGIKARARLDALKRLIIKRQTIETSYI